MFRSPSTLLMLVVTALALSGCPREVSLRGDQTAPTGMPRPGVVDIAGEPLPGVAVSVHGTERQTVTSATGQYRLSAPVGYQQIEFFKTGYTPAQVVMEIAEPGAVEVPQTVMWPLPVSQGVFAFEGNRYRSLTRVEPKRFMVGDSAPVFGSRKGAETFIDPKAIPMLIVYRLPGYDMQLSRLRSIEATPAEAVDSAAGYQVPIWTTEARLPMHTQPVDQPLGILVQAIPDVPLTPGDYAIHWGGYDGHFTTDARAYLFRILPEAEAETTEATEAPDAEADADSEPKPAE